MKLFDSEIKLMEILWEKGALNAKLLSGIAAEEIGWNKNTTYTVLKKLVEKGYVRRDEPGFVCTPLISRADAQREETKSLLDKLFGGSRQALFSALLEDESLTAEELAQLRRMVEKR